MELMRSAGWPGNVLARWHTLARPMIEDLFDQARQTTRVTRQDTLASDVNLRVPGLVIVGHPDSGRVGEEVALPKLGSASTVEISRLAPAFAQPGQEVFRPLDDAYLSRSPILLSPGPETGSVELDRMGSPMTVLAGDQDIERRRIFTPAEVARGVVLVLSGRVTLLLHLVDPVPISVPHFGLVGESSATVRLRQEIRSAAKLDIPVLLRGETGTGKELVAKALHDAGPRCRGPYLAVSLAALPASLAASELFGVTRGAYTGADRNKQGYFQSAQGGTLFLDEIGEAPIEVQVLLLRALEAGEVQPVGSVEPEPIDVRVIAATDLALDAAIVEGRFRAPLLHRLAGFEIHLPPLRQRRDDVARLLFHFLRQESEVPAAAASGSSEANQAWPTAALIASLVDYDWPGNGRQLRNVARRLAIARQEGMSAHALSQLVDQLLTDAPRPQLPSQQGVASVPEGGASSQGALRRPFEVSEAELLAALEAHRWQLKPTARALRVSRSTLYRLIEGAPGIRKASDLESPEILQALEQSSGNTNSAALELRVSPQGLKRRMKALGLT